MLKEFQNKFKVNEYMIYESEHWAWSLRPHQATIGSGILSLKRESAKFSDLKIEEYTDLNNIIKVIEPTLKEIFDYEIMNYFMLMMFDKHVHYHLLPRYSKSIDFLGETWKDDNYPGIPALVGDSLLDNQMQEIVKIIKKNIIKDEIE